jgi:hypothetical protein
MHQYAVSGHLVRRAWSTQALNSKVREKWGVDENSGARQKLKKNMFSQLKKLQELEIHTTYIPFLQRAFTTIVLNVLAQSKWKVMNSLSALVSRINGFSVACLSLVLHVRVFSKPRTRKKANRFVFKNICQGLSLTKMTPFGPRGLTQLRTHWPWHFWCRT